MGFRANQCVMWLLFFWAVKLQIGLLPAQGVLERAVDVPFISGSDTLAFPLAGGLNNPQVWAARLDADTLDDLVVFDRTGGRWLPFVRLPGGGFRFAPEQAEGWPQAGHWAVVADWNCDGVPDLFTGTTAGHVRVFRGRRAGGKLHFDLYTDTLRYRFQGQWLPLMVLDIDIPGMADVDVNGALDVLTFEPAGGHLEWFRNRSMAWAATCDTLLLELADRCWGEFYETGIHKTVLLDSCVPVRFGKQGIPPVRHAGSTVAPFDVDGDGIMDVVLGDLNFTNLNLLMNGGTDTVSRITAQDTAFPANSLPVDMPNFPAAFFVDVDGDGRTDLLAAPNNPNASIDADNLWYYRNTGTGPQAEFTFQRKDWLVGDMVDVGTRACPVVWDWNGDGLPDLIIGNESRRTGTQTEWASLQLWENVGTATKSAFQLVTDDFAGLAQFQLKALYPAFADLDGDGADDMLVGDSEGRVHFFRNHATQGQPASFPVIQPGYFGINIGSFATPQLIDIDEDGLFDLVIGERNGNLNYFRNTGTATQPQFAAQPDDDFFGEVDARAPGFPVGFSVPHFYRPAPGAPLVLVLGTIRGNLYRYTGIGTTAPFLRTDTLWHGLRPGSCSAPFMADLNGDNMPDLVVGNLSGGIEIWYGGPGTGTGPERARHGLKLYPNPSEGYITIEIPPDNTGNAQITIYAVDGKVMISESTSGNSHIRLETITFQPGCYIVELLTGSHVFTGNFIKQ
jgi:hypothetical protein